MISSPVATFCSSFHEAFLNFSEPMVTYGALELPTEELMKNMYCDCSELIKDMFDEQVWKLMR